jgi:hypothetical protein
MGILIPEYSYDVVGLQLANVYASTYGTEFRIRNEKTQGLILTFTYFLWVSLDTRRANKSCMGSFSKHIPYDDTFPVMTQVYNAIKADFTETVDVLMDPQSNSESV